ncbi:unnamed protein product, partial [Closterium sp. Naga37s-1]
MPARSPHGHYPHAPRPRFRFRRDVRYSRYERQTRPVRQCVVSTVCCLLLLLASCHAPLSSADKPSLPAARGNTQRGQGGGEAEGAAEDGGEGGGVGGRGGRGSAGRPHGEVVGGAVSGGGWGDEGSRLREQIWSWSWATRVISGWMNGQVKGQYFQLNELEGQVNGQQSVRSVERGEGEGATGSADIWASESGMGGGSSNTAGSGSGSAAGVRKGDGTGVCADKRVGGTGGGGAVDGAAGGAERVEAEAEGQERVQDWGAGRVMDVDGDVTDVDGDVDGDVDMELRACARGLLSSDIQPSPATADAG